MEPSSLAATNATIRSFIRVMAVIAFGFVALYVFIFLQLKQTESQLTSYGNVTDSAIGNFLTNLPDTGAIKISKTDSGLTFALKEGQGSALNADLIDGYDSKYFLNASNLSDGKLKDSLFSSWKNLESEGIVSNGRIKPEYLPSTSQILGTASIKWSDIINRPVGLDDGDDTGIALTESQVENFITNSAISLATGSTINSQPIATHDWIYSQNFITGLNYAQIANGTGIYSDYRPDNVACTQDQVLKYDAGLNHWICANDAGSSALAWGGISGTLADQTDLNSALGNKLDSVATFGGDVTGTYDNLAVADDAHAHTGVTISGLGTANFTSTNISQWTNDSGYISGLNFSQIANGTGVYLNYKPNDIACGHNQVLKYDAALTQWICGDDTGAGVVAWGTITGTLSDQTDLSTALSSKLNLTAAFGGDVSGTYDNIAIANDSHAHTGATISGLGASNFTSANISQWTNDSGYISGVDISQIANGSGKYFNYKPNDVACTEGQVLKYDATNARWTCGSDNTGAGGGGGVVTSVNTIQTRTQGIYSAVTTGDGTEITPLTITFTPKKSGNKIILEWVINGEVFQDTVFNVSRNGVVLTDSDNGVNRWSGISAWPYDNNQVSTPENVIVRIIDENSLDTASTYRLLVRSAYGTVNNFYLNRTIGSAGQDSYETMLSTGTATEIDPSATAGGGEIVVGSMTGTSLFADATASNQWLGLGAGAGRIEFDDQTIDEINFLDANIGIGTSTPQHKLDINGNIGLATSGYINFGATDGILGYGLRDNSGVLEYKDATGSWTAIASLANISGSGYSFSYTGSPSSIGQAANRNTGGTFTSQTGDLFLYDPYYLQKVYWDIYKAGTYTLTIFDATTNTVLSTVSNIVVSSDASVNVEFLLPTPIIVSSYVKFTITSNSGVKQWYDRNSSGYDGFFRTNGLYYDTTYYGPYTVPIHLYGVTGVLVQSGGGGISGVTVGSMTGISVFSDATADDDWVGLGATAGLMEFDDQATDEINFLNANIGIGTSTPQHKLDVNGNIGIVASGYLNFGTTDGTTGYGIRDNAGKVEVKNNGGDWKAVDGAPSWQSTPDEPPATANAMDDEFNNTTLDPKWTIYTDVPPGSYAVTEANKQLLLSYPSTAANTYRFISVVQAAPVGNWKFRTKLTIEGSLWTYTGGGWLIRNTSSNKNFFFAYIKHTSMGDGLTAYYGRATGATLNTEVDLGNYFNQTVYLEMEYDGTNLYYRTSSTGVNYTLTYTEPISNLGAAPEYVGVTMHPYNSIAGINTPMISVDWFRRIQ